MIIANKNTEKIELQCNNIFPSDMYLDPDNTIVIDLLNIFLEIYVKDISTKRSGNKSRSISISAFVDRKNLHIWEENKNIIKELTEFVTEGDGDKWLISFDGIDYEFINQQMVLPSDGVDNISLLSGGLDSFCGAYQNEMNRTNTVYCGYKTSNVDTAAINDVSDFLKKRKWNLGIYTYSRVPINKILYTQRTRSLLFFSLAVISAIIQDTTIVNIYENGIMTLNPSFQTRGTTKTTHPKTIYLYQQILTNAGINVKLNHPFLFMTKGEIVSRLNSEFKAHIKNTRSCSRSMHNRNYDVSRQKSCGTCVPCLLRKISMAAYDLEDLDNDYIIPYSGNADDSEYRSALNYYKTFYNSIVSNEIFSEILVRGKFYQSDDYLERTYEMLKKFSKEIEVFLKKYDR